MVTCSRFAVALASTAEGETTGCLHGWEGPLGVVWLRRSAGCGCGHPGRHCHGRCIIVDPLDACSLVLGSVLPCVVDVRCCANLAVGLLILCGVLSLYHLCFLLNTILVHAS
jgi:hypothetical protein